MKDLLSTIEAAEYMGYAEITLRNSRYSGLLSGVPAPKFSNIGRRIVYRKSDLDKWASDLMGESSSSDDHIQKWVCENYPTKSSSLNKCNEAVRRIISEFDGLTVQVGYCNGVYHCWCINKDGEIIDPTANQFDGKLKYTLIASRFLKKTEIELSTGAIFLDENEEG